MALTRLIEHSVKASRFAILNKLYIYKPIWGNLLCSISYAKNIYNTTFVWNRTIIILLTDIVLIDRQSLKKYVYFTHNPMQLIANRFVFQLYDSIQTLNTFAHTLSSMLYNSYIPSYMDVQMIEAVSRP